MKLLITAAAAAASLATLGTAAIAQPYGHAYGYHRNHHRDFHPIHRMHHYDRRHYR